MIECIKFMSKIYLKANLESADGFQQEVSIINSKQIYCLSP